ncbi:DUF6216 family protein [Erwinia sp. CGal63]|uniref:DUF6216 family protein n=1 Tax=Erwinia sp. CGal63 TaxID=2919889 RepID=UPI00300AED84
MDSFVQFVEKFDSLFKFSLALLIILTIWLYFYKKSGSLYSISDKLWSLFVGKKDFYHKRLDAFHKEQHDVDKFNAIYNVKAITTQEIEAFTRWIKEQKHDVRKISGLKGWFTVSTLTVRKPGITSTVLVAIFFISLILSGLFVSLCGLTPNAIVRLDKQDPWFVINHQRAKPLFSDVAITASDCADSGYNRGDFARRSGITPSSVNGICQAFQDKKEAAAIDKIIRSQRILLYLGLYILFFGGYTLKYFHRRLNALDFIALTKKRSGQG